MPHGIGTPTPIGCLVGFFGLISIALSAMCFWAAYLAFTRSPPEPDLGWKLILAGAGAALPAFLGIAYALYRIVTAGKHDHYNIGTTLRS